MSMKLFQKLFLSFLGILISLFVAEIFLKIFWSPPFLDKDYKRNDLDWTSKHVELNRFGYRDRNFSFEKRENTFRTYVLGDSYTYGWYINNVEDSYPKVLEKLLSQKYVGDEIEVINASKPGYNFSDEVNRFKQEGVVFSPDLVLVGVNIFDFLSNSHVYAPKPYFPENTRLYQLTIGNFRRISAARKMDKEIKSTYLKDSPQMSNFVNKIREIKNISQEIGSSLAVVVFPDYDPASPNKTTRYPDYEKELRNIAQSEDVKMIFLSNYFDSVEDKISLVLNPVDPHPTIETNKLAAGAILEELDFDSLVSRKGFGLKQGVVNLRVGANMFGYKAIVSTNSMGWVYFDEVYGDSIQQIFLPNIDDKRATYLEDVLKTAKLSKHEGWVGAKVEHNIPLIGSESFDISDNIYGFDVGGISQFTIFWREEGSLHSLDLGLDNLDVSREEGKIHFEIKTDGKKSIDLVRVVLDVSVGQFDINNGVVVEIGETEIFSGREIKIDKKILSLPKFTVSGSGRGYVWCNGKLQEADISYSDNLLKVNTNACLEGSILEFPVMVAGSGNLTGVIVKYLY